jgi:uncharacterized damage-inducible protein DinB
MNNELQSIISNLQNVLSGHPWFGRSVYEILAETDEAKVFVRPNAEAHSLADLLYHMLTWAEFTQKRIEKEAIENMTALEAMDWRVIDPAQHSWKKGVAALKASHKKIIDLLQSKEDAFLEEKVDYRKYNFRFLLNGLIQHNIYHLGQVAYASKLL